MLLVHRTAYVCSAPNHRATLTIERLDTSKEDWKRNYGKGRLFVTKERGWAARVGGTLDQAA